MEFLDERFWLAACFVIFVYIAYRPVKKAILNSLDNKISAIKAYLSEAEKLKNEAEKLLQKTEQQMLDLDNLKSQIMSKAQEQVDNLIAHRNQEIEKLMERREQDMLTDLKVSQEQTIREVQAELMSKVTNVVTTYFIDQRSKSSDLDIAKNINGKKDFFTE